MWKDKALIRKRTFISVTIFVLRKKNEMCKMQKNPEFKVMDQLDGLGYDKTALTSSGRVD